MWLERTKQRPVPRVARLRHTTLFGNVCTVTILLVLRNWQVMRADAASNVVPVVAKWPLRTAQNTAKGAEKSLRRRISGKRRPSVAKNRPNVARLERSFHWLANVKRPKTMSNANIVASPLNEAEWLLNDVQETHIPSENPQLRQVTRSPSITPISRTSSLQPFDQTNNELDVNLDIGSLFSQESSEVQDASIEEFLKEINHELTSELFDNTSGPDTAQQDQFVPTYINAEAHPELNSMDLAFLDEISNGALGGVELEDEVSV